MTSIVVVWPAVGHLLLLHRVLAPAVPLHQADHQAHPQQEDDGQQHPDEPAGGGEGALLRLVAGRYVQVRVYALRNKKV